MTRRRPGAKMVGHEGMKRNVHSIELHLQKTQTFGVSLTNLTTAPYFKRMANKIARER